MKLKKIALLVITLTCCIPLVNVSAKAKEPVEITKEFIKQKAKHQGKELNVIEYERALAKAETNMEKDQISKNLDKYIVYTRNSISQINDQNQSIVSTAIGDTRIVNGYIYGQETTYASKSGSLSTMTQKLIELGASFKNKLWN